MIYMRPTLLRLFKKGGIFYQRVVDSCSKCCRLLGRAMCNIYMIVHVKYPKEITGREGHRVQTAGLCQVAGHCLLLYGLHVL